MNFKTSETKTLYLKEHPAATLSYLRYFTQYYLDAIKSLKISENIFQKYSLKLEDDVQVFFSSSMWQLR